MLEYKSEKVIIENIHVIDGKGNEFFKQNVLIQDGKIAKVQANKIFALFTKRIDGTGKTLMPGLIDSHTHMQGMNNRSEEESDAFLAGRVSTIFKEQLFPYGITTIKDLGSPRHFSYKLRDKINRGEIMGPKFLIVGPNITAVGGHPAVTLGGDNLWVKKELAAEVDSESAARSIVRELAENHVDFLKIVYQGGPYFYFDTELSIQKLNIKYVNIIIEEAEKVGLKVTAHVRYKKDVAELLTTGLYGIEHGITDESITEKDTILAQWTKQGAYYVPTMHALFLEHEKSLFQHGMHNLKFIYDSGIPIALGTDNMLEVLSGDVVHRELSFYVEAGLTIMQAIVTATGNGAGYLGIDNRTGTIEAGKDADLILLNKNPLEDIHNMQSIQMVWKEGIRVFEKNTFSNEVLPEYRLENRKNCTYLDEMLKSKGITGSRTYLYEPTDTNQFKIRVDFESNGNKGKTENFITDKTLMTKQWHFTDIENGSDMNACVKDNEVILTGIFHNKEVNRTYDMTGKLWLQMGEINLATFAVSQAEEIHYYGIGSKDGRGALEMTEFTSKKAGNESLEINGTARECVKILTVITKYAFIWTGIGWYDLKTGDLLKYAVKDRESDAMKAIDVQPCA